MQTAPNPLLATLLMVVASALIGFTSLLAKALGTDALGPALHPMQVSHGRFLFALIAVGTAAAIIRPAIVRPQWRLHMARTSCGWLGITLMFAAAAQIPLSDATAISFLNPVFTMVLAIPLLGERVGRIRWSAAAIALIGALVLLRPGTAAFQIGALLALASAVIIGLEVIFIKRLTRSEGAFQVLLINNSMGLIIATLAVIAVWEAPTGLQWAALACLGVCMSLAQTCFLNAMMRADASFAVPFSYGTLVFAALYDAALFGVIPDSVSLAGAGIIISGAAMLVWREATRRRAG